MQLLTTQGEEEDEDEGKMKTMPTKFLKVKVDNSLLPMTTDLCRNERTQPKDKEQCLSEQKQLLISTEVTVCVGLFRINVTGKGTELVTARLGLYVHTGDCQNSLLSEATGGMNFGASAHPTESHPIKPTSRSSPLAMCV